MRQFTSFNALFSSIRFEWRNLLPTNAETPTKYSLARSQGKDLDTHLRALNNPTFSDFNRGMIIEGLAAFTDSQNQSKVKEVLAHIIDCKEETPEFRICAKNTLQIIELLQGKTKDLPTLLRGFNFDLNIGEDSHGLITCQQMQLHNTCDNFLKRMLRDRRTETANKKLIQSTLDRHFEKVQKVIAEANARNLIDS